MIQARYGGLKLFWHPEKIKSILEGKVTAPIYVRFKPTNLCNHHCSFCSYEPNTGDRSVRDKMDNRRDQLSREKILETLEDFAEMGVKAVTYSGGGEPLLHPNIAEAMQKTIDSKIQLSIITNGQRLYGDSAKILANANWVRISSDASDAKSFSDIRRVPEFWFDQLTKNIAEFAKIKNKNCELGINYVVHHKNADQVYRSVKHFKNLGANHIKITPMWITNFKEYHQPTMESVVSQIKEARKDFQDSKFEVFDTYEKDFSGCSVSHRDYFRCYIMQITPVIGADGNVYFCHDKAYSSSGLLGSIKDKSFKELWFGKEAAKIFANFNPKESCNHHCANDAKNMFIQEAIHCYGPDINFI